MSSCSGSWSITFCVYFNNRGLYSFNGFCLDCLRSFTDLEELDETELYFCHKCKKRQKSTKKFWVQKLPKVGVHTFSSYLVTFTHFTPLIHERCVKTLFRWRWLFPPLGSLSAPEEVPLDSLFTEQDRHLCRISIERSGHEGLLTWGELKNKKNKLGMP